MKLEKHTFGNSKSAQVLVELLRHTNKKEAQKISKFIHQLC